MQLCVCVHPSVCMCYEYLMCCSVFMMFKDRGKESRDREVGENKTVGDLNHLTRTYGCHGHKAVVFDYGHNGEPGC